MRRVGRLERDDTAAGVLAEKQGLRTLEYFDLL